MAGLGEQGGGIKEQPVYSSEFEPIGGNLLQMIALYYNAFKPVNGSYIQAICEAFGMGGGKGGSEPIYEPTNGSWLNTFAILTYDNSEIKYPIDPETGDYCYDEFDNLISIPFELINGDYWQTILYYSNASEQSFLDNFELEVSFPINGSWMNTFYQWLRNYNDGVITENGYILLSSEPTWTGNNTYVFGRSVIVFLDDDNLITDGDGFGAGGNIRFDSNTTYIPSVNYIVGGSGYKVGDTITLPSLTIPEITGDIVFTVLEVVEY
jgi:hypothetical protein